MNKNLSEHPGVWKTFWAGTLLAVTCLTVSLCRADEFKPDMQSVVRDCQQMTQAQRQMTLVWWIPPQFWRASFQANPKMTPAQINDFMKTVKPYTVFAVVKGSFGSFGGMTYESEDALRGELVLVDRDGQEYRPLNDANIGADMQNFLGIMKPMFANMMGAMGKNFDFFVFPALGKDGRPIADAEKEGQFSVRVGPESFKWRLPLGCFLAPKLCPKCGEKLSGAYKFCPFDGTLLEK